MQSRKQAERARRRAAERALGSPPRVRRAAIRLATAQRSQMTAATRDGADLRKFPAFRP
jgi:hypothetical protein